MGRTLRHRLRIPGGIPCLVFFLVGSLQGCGASSDGSEAETMNDGPVTYLALGDSYTIGESVDSIHRWPVLLAQALGQEGVATQEPVIVARTGWTTDELSAGIQEAGVTGTYDLVSLLIGVNNQYRGRDPEEYRGQLVALLREAVAFAGGDPGRVLVLSIPDWGVMPFAEGRDRDEIGRAIDLFNEIKRTESSSAGVHYVDITPISREARNDPELVAGDGLHPSGAMYARWAELALPVTVEILGSSAGGHSGG